MDRDRRQPIRLARRRSKETSACCRASANEAEEETEMRTWTRRGVMVVTAASLIPAAALAETWPAKPVTFIVCFPAGGPTDLLARKLASLISERSGQPIVVENITGAYGAIGLQRLARAQPDGYTIGLGMVGTQTIAPHVNPVPYDPIKDFTPITMVAKHANAVVVKADSPIQSIGDLIAEAKRKPEAVSYGDSGAASTTTLSARMLETMAGAQMLAVGYRGAAPALNDLMAGHITFYVDVIGSIAPLVRSGRLRALATTGAERNKALPDVPTVAETLPGFEMTGWFAVFGPSGIPKDTVSAMNAAIASAAASPKMIEYLDQLGYEASTSTPEELGQVVTRDLARWAPILKAKGLN
jgi:tripartite-type tricarboxylate transporter receptor subunit TctC